MIQHNKPTIGKKESIAVNAVLKSGMLAQGKKVRQFEMQLASHLGIPSKNVVCVSSGSAALYISLKIMLDKKVSIPKIGIPAYSCSSLWYAAQMLKSRTVVFDISTKSVNIDLSKIKNTDLDVAIVPHMFGLPSKLSCKDYSFPIIEDSAQSLGAVIEGKHVGLQTEVGIFSFYATKLITSGGQGGAIVSKNTLTAESARDIRDFDCKPINKNRFNFQMTDLQAAVGLIQLSRLNEFIIKREKLFTRYVFRGIKLIGEELDASKKCVPVRYRAVHITKKPNKMIKYLYKNNINSIIPINDWELLTKKNNAPKAYKISKQTISLPLYPSLMLKDISYIADTVNDYYIKYPGDRIN